MQPFNNREILDKDFVDGDWRLLYSKVKATHISICRSDHVPILLDANGESLSWPRPFRSKDMFSVDKFSRDVADGVYHVWIGGSSAF